MMYLQASCLRPNANPRLVNLKKSPFTVVALSKKADHFLYLLASSAGDSNVSNRLINKFVMSSPKSLSLEILSHLLSPETSDHLIPHAFPVYLNIVESSWYIRNPKLVALMAALLRKQGKTMESETLILDTLQHCKSERDLSLFLCELLDSHANHGSCNGFDEAYSRMQKLVEESGSVYVKRQCRKAMLKGLCMMGKPAEAEGLLTGKGTIFEQRCLLEGYGKMGMHSEMERVLNLMTSKDTVAFNMVIRRCGVGDVAAQVRRMKEAGVPVTLRTCNTVLNRCGTLMEMVTGAEGELDGEEGAVVEEMGRRAMGIEGVAKWEEREWKVDLHGMHLGTAYAVMVEWIGEVERRIGEGDRCGVEVTVVSGAGRGSSRRGESPVKDLVRRMIGEVGIPLRRDMRNGGCFVAKGKSIEGWVRSKRMKEEDE